MIYSYFHEIISQNSIIIIIRIIIITVNIYLFIWKVILYLYLAFKLLKKYKISIRYILLY